MSSHLRKRCAKCTLDELIRESAPTNSKARTPYWRLITAIRASSQLLHPEPFRGDALLASHDDVLRACVQIVRKRGFWKRRPESWVAPNSNLFEQLKSLVSHLFERFDVPMFLTTDHQEYSAYAKRDDAKTAVALLLCRTSSHTPCKM